MSIRFSIRDSGLCEPQLNLLAHAQAIELDIGSECGGHGVCGGDRVRIPEAFRDDFSRVTAEEREHLSPEELENGWRLGCQCFPERAGLELVLELTSKVLRKIN
jgi:ferredoxin